MNKFLDNDFLLLSKTAKTLFHGYAEKMPLLDYHCHLPAQAIAENKRFKNITQIWLYGDHYKWRLMRSNGAPEELCTGNATDWKKFLAWAETLPFAIRNPIYHWSHLELKNYFGINETLTPKTAKAIFEKCNRVIKEENLTPFEIFRRMNVKALCTTDDPTDSLQYHQELNEKNECPAKVYPTFRPDKAMSVENPTLFNKWVNQLSRASGIDIHDFISYLVALRARYDFFHQLGCRISDHGLETPCAQDYTNHEIYEIFKKLRLGQKLHIIEINKFKTAMMVKFGEWNHEKGWAMQLHMGVIRNNNSRMMKKLGPDTGFDSAGDFQIAKPLSRFLDMLDSKGRLPKTILYSANPKDNAVLATMLGNFQDETVPGKIQMGSAWWFLDNIDGMEEQMKALSNMGLLSRFIGMLTDSRSFLSYPRHEYFRRILCNMLGGDIECGRLPDDIKSTGKIVQDICYNNAVNYFKLP